MQMFRIIALCGLALLAGCGLAPQQKSGDILVIGESVMAWNQATIGQVMASDLKRDVVSRAALGARVRASPSARLLGLSVPDQLSLGRWNWVVMNGGANDLAGSCGCASCDDVIDALMTGDAGYIPDLIAKAQRSGARVLWMGYYQAPTSPSFKNCRSGLVELERRIQTYARSHDGVYFVDAEDVFDAGDPSLLASDKTHPSRKGSVMLGAFLARTIAAMP